MSGSIAVLGIFLGGAGIVVGVIALMYGGDVARRISGVVDARLRQSELELLKGLDKQDMELKRQRRALSDALDAMEERLEAMKSGLDDTTGRIKAINKVLTDLGKAKSAVKSGDDRGFDQSNLAAVLPFSK